MTGALLELANVRKSFTRGGLLSHRRVQAVDDVSFRIAADEPDIFTIIGESGSGKSTLARMILNIDAADERLDRLSRPRPVDDPR